MTRRLSLLPLVLACCATPTLAACTAQSGPTRNVALELYTSEGCDSCPPADRWLSSWRSRARKDVVPLAFHVDYWDRLGWRDPFGQAAFSERQRDLASAAGQRMVYTPQVLLQGRDVRDWRDATALQQRMDEILRSPAQADIRLHLDDATPGQWRIRAVYTQRQAGPAKAYLALVQHNLSSAVEAGENRGKQLQHDYVVRQWWGPLDVPNGAVTVTRQAEVPATLSRGNLSLAAWVQNPATGDVLQILSLSGCWN